MNKSGLNFIAIIPSRYASTRFPGKPLADIKGKSMIQRVYERAAEVLDCVWVATDDKRIYEAVKSFGGNPVMTSELHQSGTDRCFEALKKVEKSENQKFDVIINIQGDEPFIKPVQIGQLMDCFVDEEVDIATLIKTIEDPSVIFDPNRPKVVVDKKQRALYFSRSPIPFIRGSEEGEWNSKHNFYQHIGMYAYRSEVLQKITSLNQGILEKAESLEQLRWLENGFNIQTAITEFESYGIDTPEDLRKILQLNIF
jgi:3-deoxy-manno-octulosonate cytidylyltransferase (CMP-KDO synthetase)